MILQTYSGRVEAFLAGWGSVVNVFPSVHYDSFKLQYGGAWNDNPDAVAIAHDWVKVTGDLGAAFEAVLPAETEGREAA